MANRNANKIPMSDAPVWARVMRPRVPLVYLDLSHFILMARAHAGDPKVPAAYCVVWEHLFEMSAIADPRQRSDLADHLPLVGPSFGRAFGWRGGVSIRDAQGADLEAQLRQELGDDAYEQKIRTLNYIFERQMLQGPSDADADTLRTEYGYHPEMARQAQHSRLAFELELSKLLESSPKWRRGRLRDLVSGREIAHEWLDAFSDVNEERARLGRLPLDPADDRMPQFIAAMPHVQVAISMKTRYHRNPTHRWSVNDIVDIDALSIAYAYCDVVFTDSAARAALIDSPELRHFGAYLPRTAVELAGWLDRQPVLSSGHLLIPAGRTPHKAN